MMPYLLSSMLYVLLDGLVSYSMPQGERRGSEVDLFDFTYDGRNTTTAQGVTYLLGGLGQLTDGAEGQNNFRLDPDTVGKKGYEWVGWKNETVDRPPIQIVFEFDKIRNFTSVRFHCNNMFSKDVRVFRKAVLYFGLTSSMYQEYPVVFEYMRDTLIEFARYSIITIPHRVGRFVKVELYFDAKWLMVSEVHFESGQCLWFMLYSACLANSATVSSLTVHCPWKMRR